MSQQGLYRSFGRAEDGHNVSVLEDFFVRDPAVRAERVIAAPRRPHLFSASHSLAERIDEYVVFCHYRCELINIAFVD